MSDKPHNRNSDEDAILSKLIRASRKKPAGGFVRPDGEAITVYLLGTATKEQEKAVKAALLQSAAFRQEILGMAEDMDALASPELLAEKKEAAKIAVPDRREFLARYGERIDTRDETESFWAKLKKWGIPQIYGPALAVAAVLAFVIIQTGIFAPGRKMVQWSLVSENMDPALLVSNITREASEGALGKASPNSKEAALREFRYLLKYENIQFQLNPVEKRPEPPFPSRSVLLRLIDVSDSPIQGFQAHIPIAQAGSSEPVIAWALGLPSRNLYSFEMPSDTVAVKWTKEMGSKGCVTFTYHDEGGYRAVAGFTFDLR